MDVPAPAPVVTQARQDAISSVAFSLLAITPWIGGPLFLDLANIRSEHVQGFLVTMLALVMLRVALILIARVSSYRLVRSSSSYRATGAAVLLVAAAILGVLAAEIMRHWFATEMIVIIPFYLHIGLLSVSWMPLQWHHPLFPFWFYLAAQTSLAFLSFICFTRAFSPAVLLLALIVALPSALRSLLVILVGSHNKLDTDRGSAVSDDVTVSDKVTSASEAGRSRIMALTTRWAGRLGPHVKKLPLSAIHISQHDLVNILLIAPPLLVGLGVHLSYLPRIYLLAYLALPFTLTLSRKIREQSLNIERLYSRIALTSAILPIILVAVKIV